MPGADGAGFGRTSLSHGGGKSARERMDGPVTRRSNNSPINSPGSSPLTRRSNNIGEAAYSPQRSSRGLPPISSRSKPGTYKTMPTHLNEAQGRALVRARQFRKTHKVATDQIEVPLQQVRQMFQGRMQSIVMQNRKQVRQLFRTWDVNNKGELTATQFRELLQEFGVPCTKERADEIMDKFASTKAGCITFDEFFFGLMGFPHDFFTMNLNAKEDSVDKGSNGRVLMPANTPQAHVEQFFKTKVRKMLFNVELVINNVFERQTNGKVGMSKDCFWTMLNANGMMLTKAELDEMFTHFDLNCDGIIGYYEFAHELLKLPRPGEMKHQTSWHNKRPLMGPRCQLIFKKLREKCERTAAPPSALYQLFKTYDQDGSGCIAYDEMQELVRETGAGVEGKDMAALLLDKYSGGSGEIPYMKFITLVLELGEDALNPPNKFGDRRGIITPEVVQKVSSGVKTKIYSSDDALKRAFKLFDPDGSGECRVAEFMDGVKQLGLPISIPQMKLLFKEFSENDGTFTVAQLASKVLHGGGKSQTPEMHASRTPAGLTQPFGYSRTMGSMSSRSRGSPIMSTFASSAHWPVGQAHSPAPTSNPARAYLCQSAPPFLRQPGSGRPPKTGTPYVHHPMHSPLRSPPKTAASRLGGMTARSGFSLTKMGLC